MEHQVTHEKLRARLQALSSAAIADAVGGGVISTGLSRLTGTGVIAGRAITARCSKGSGVPMVTASEHAQTGDILCAQADGDLAYIGDLLGAHFQAHGIAAVVFEGRVRDVAMLRQGSVSYYAKGTHPIAPRKREPGPSMQPIELAGTPITPGDWVVLDDDGAVVIPVADVERVLAQAEAQEARESKVRALINSGISIAQAFEQVQQNNTTR